MLANDEMLKDAIARIESGQIDADLGGNVYKQRVARKHEGKSGGYRTIICYRIRERAFFVYGFPKSKRQNITKSEESNLKKQAEILLNITGEDMQKLLASGTFEEIL